MVTRSDLSKRHPNQQTIDAQHWANTPTSAASLFCSTDLEGFKYYHLAQMRNGSMYARFLGMQLSTLEMQWSSSHMGCFDQISTESWHHQVFKASAHAIALCTLLDLRIVSCCVDSRDLV